MARKELSRCLRREVDKWAAESFDDLRRKLARAVHYRSMIEGQEYQVEAQLLEDTEDYAHVAVSVDDGTLARSVVPLSTSFLVYRDGRVDKPTV
jgi:hypothetical protein